MRNLGGYYRSLSLNIQQPHTLLERFFPPINTFCGSDGVTVKFKYIKYLELDPLCTTFLAVTEAPVSKNIVVKFVHRYNDVAHTLLADNDMAPNLLFYGKLSSVRDTYPSCDGLNMVVMDYIDGLTADIAHMRKLLPPDFLDQVRRILALLHHHNYVFGDLRGPNIMVTKDNKVMFIDFDWVGKDGESHYPIIMAQTIDWPEGVKDGLGVMLKEHDTHMLLRLLP